MWRTPIVWRYCHLCIALRSEFHVASGLLRLLRMQRVIGRFDLFPSRGPSVLRASSCGNAEATLLCLRWGECRIANSAAIKSTCSPLKSSFLCLLREFSVDGADLLALSTFYLHHPQFTMIAFNIYLFTAATSLSTEFGDLNVWQVRRNEMCKNELGHQKDIKTKMHALNEKFINGTQIHIHLIELLLATVPNACSMGRVALTGMDGTIHFNSVNKITIRRI